MRKRDIRKARKAVRHMKTQQHRDRKKEAKKRGLWPEDLDPVARFGVPI